MKEFLRFVLENSKIYLKWIYLSFVVNSIYFMFVDFPIYNSPKNRKI